MACLAAEHGIVDRRRVERLEMPKEEPPAGSSPHQITGHGPNPGGSRTLSGPRGIRASRKCESFGSAKDANAVEQWSDGTDRHGVEVEIDPAVHIEQSGAQDIGACRGLPEQPKKVDEAPSSRADGLDGPLRIQPACLDPW